MENLEEIAERFYNGTETIEDIMYHCQNYKITFNDGEKFNLVEKKYLDKLVKVLEQYKNRIENSISKDKVKEIINKYSYENGKGGYYMSSECYKNFIKEIVGLVGYDFKEE